MEDAIMARKRKPKAPEPHPDVEYDWLGVELGLASAKAKIKREWEAAFDVEFPGWSRDALKRVASFAKVPEAEIKPDSFFNAIRIYRTAIAKKKTRLVAVKSGKTLRLIRKGDGDGKCRAALTIPPAHRTRAMTKQRAARYLRGGNADSAVEWLNKCIIDGTITCETLSRQSHVFDVRQFPESVRDSILPPIAPASAGKCR
jgi:hypothetical protein